MTAINLGVLSYEEKDYGGAVGWFEEALALRPDGALARSKLGSALWLLGRDEEALGHLREAVRLGPNEASAYHALGQALSDQGRYAEAAEELGAAARLKPGVAYRLAFAAALDRAGGDAGPLVRQVAAGDPRWAEGVTREARALAEHPRATPRDGLHAAEVIRLACKFSGEKKPRLYDALAVAYARAGLLPEAVSAAEEALSAAEAARQPELARAIAGRLSQYRGQMSGGR
jgi:tetratricopeptide (TPR) repeat protein